VLATRRTLVGFGLALLGLVALGTAATVVDARNSEPVDVARALRDVVSDAAGAAVFISLLLGLLVSTWEYRHRTMTHSVLAAPRRDRLLAAKASVGFVLGLLLAAVGAVLSLAIAVPWLGSDAPGELGGADLLARVGQLLAGAGLWGVLGVAVGALVTSQVGAVISSLVWLLIVEPVLGALPGPVAPYLPSHAMQALLGSDTGDLSAGGGLGIVLAYLAVFGAVAVVTTQQRDIS